MSGIRILLLFGLVTIGSALSLELGDECQPPSLKSTKNIRGKCQFLRQCPELIEGLRKGRYPFICGYYGLESIVCCPTVTKIQERLLNSETKSETTAKPKLGPVLKPELEPIPETKLRPDRISKQKCMEYGKSVFKMIPTTTIEGTRYENKSTCVKYEENLLPTIFAKQEEFPHMALIGRGSKNNIEWICSGSLISEKFVLTVAHCTISGFNNDIKWVRLGDLDFQSPNDESDFLTLSIIAIYRHPEFRLPILYNDIALLELESPVPISEYVRPACLYDGSDSMLDKFIISGWALVSATENRGHLRQFKNLMKVENKICNEEYKNLVGRRLQEGIKEELMICTNEADNDACQISSGAALQIFNRDSYCMYDVVGLLSFGKGFCLSKFSSPSSIIHTRISPYVDWIESIVWSQNK